MKDLYLKLPPIKLLTGLQLLLLSLLFVGLAMSLKPAEHYAKADTHFEQDIPKSFGNWREVVNSVPQVRVVSDERSLESQLYDDMLMRTYIDDQGHQIMVALAYAKEQRQDIKVHQPDVCYPAQGYQLVQSEVTNFNPVAKSAPVIGKKQLYAGQGHLEAVSYWIRVGDSTLTSGLQMRLKIIKDGLFKHRLDDGMLVRVSSAIADESKLSEAHDLHQKFLANFVPAVEQTSPGLLMP